MRFQCAALCCLLAALMLATATPSFAADRWSEEQAKAWYDRQPWLVGSDYIPATAINQLEMWQAETFDPATIDKEFALAEGMGMNTMRVFLHDLVWQQDADGFTKRIDRFLAIAAKHHIRPMLVLFDSCWDPRPKLGRQRAPKPGVHNSGWVQSPGAAALRDSKQEARLKTYVAGVIRAFANDDRVLAWDLWNEPSNDNQGSYHQREPKNKQALVEALLPQVFEWARSAHPSQPLTTGVWDIDMKSDRLTKIQQAQLGNSDVVSFHNYGWPEDFQRDVDYLSKFHRPLICTEFMARGAGSTFDTILPVALKNRVGAINWGFVAGKTQTYLPWESWRHPYVKSQPPIWFHEVLRQDLTPYRKAEVDLIRSLTRQANPDKGVK
jgi:Cellulase (glycosyl hydrolase family 5)